MCRKSACVVRCCAPDWGRGGLEGGLRQRSARLGGRGAEPARLRECSAQPPLAGPASGPNTPCGSTERGGGTSPCSGGASLPLLPRPRVEDHATASSSAFRSPPGTPIGIVGPKAPIVWAVGGDLIHARELPSRGTRPRPLCLRASACGPLAPGHRATADFGSGDASARGFPIVPVDRARMHAYGPRANIAPEVSCRIRNVAA